MEEPTMEEVLELVEFERNADGRLRVRMVYGNVCGSVIGNVWGDVQGCVRGSVCADVGGNVKGSVWANVYGSVFGSVKGDVLGNVWGDVQGTINGREWQFVETPKERAIRLIREGRGEEAIKVLEEE